MRSSMVTFGGVVVGWSMLVLAGCNGDATQEYKAVPAGGAAVKEHVHDHGHGAGPRGGHLVELEGGPGEFHAEVFFDADARKTTVYILGSDLDQPHPLEAGARVGMRLKDGEDEVVLDLKAVPLDTETDGKCSRFEDEGGVPGSIAGEEQFKGTVHVESGSLALSGEIAHEDAKK